jgi:hypothetical protein
MGLRVESGLGHTTPIRIPCWETTTTLIFSRHPTRVRAEELSRNLINGDTGAADIARARHMCLLFPTWCRRLFGSKCDYKAR